MGFRIILVNSRVIILKQIYFVYFYFSAYVLPNIIKNILFIIWMYKKIDSPPNYEVNWWPIYSLASYALTTEDKHLFIRPQKRKDGMRMCLFGGEIG